MSRPSGNCSMCGTYRMFLTRDHIIPKWQGGKDEESNHQFICANCHEDKTWKEHHTQEFRRLMSECSKKRVFTEEMREKMRKGMLERIKSPAYRKKISDGLRGRVVKEETKAIMRQRTSDRMQNPLVRECISLKAKERWKDPEYRQRQVEIHKSLPPPVGRPHTEAAKLKMREWQSHRPPMSEETKMKISMALKGRKKAA